MNFFLNEIFSQKTDSIHDDFVKTYLFDCSEVPVELNDKFVLVGIEANEDIDLNDLGFISSIIVNSKNQDETLRGFEDWWKENVGGSYKVELIGIGAGSLSRYRRKILKKLPLNEWSLNTNFLAYVLADSVAAQEARSIVLESDFIKQ